MAELEQLKQLEQNGRPAEALEQRLIAYRRHLHAYPELSNEEYETTASIKTWLEEAGIKVADYGLHTGVVAEVGGTGGSRRAGGDGDGGDGKGSAAKGRVEGPIIALRADIDALPIQEETGLPFASRIAGKMHACGHDFHAAAIIGAAILLKQREATLPGTVRLLFQPAEEKARGAKELVRRGVLEGVKAIFGLHNKPDLPVGAVGIAAGGIMAAADGFVVEVQGKGTHAAVPEAGIDPIVVSAHIIAALQTVVSRNVGALKQAVISVTRLNSGTAWNVIPEQAVFDGTIRTFDSEVRSLVRQRFEEVVHGVAAALGTVASVRWIEGPPPVVNSAAWVDTARSAAEAVGLEPVAPVPSLAGEDFAVYLQEVEGLFAFIGTAGAHEWHHPEFNLDERSLLPTAHFFAALAEAAITKLATDTEN